MERRYLLGKLFSGQLEKLQARRCRREFVTAALKFPKNMEYSQESFKSS